MGFDISKYALEHNTELTKPHVYFQKAQDTFKYKDKESKTLIIISHRNAAISLCNKFYKVDKKKIVKLN